MKKGIGDFFCFRMDSRGSDSFAGSLQSASGFLIDRLMRMLQHCCYFVLEHLEPMPRSFNYEMSLQVVTLETLV